MCSAFDIYGLIMKIECRVLQHLISPLLMPLRKFFRFSFFDNKKVEFIKRYFQYK